MSGSSEQLETNALLFSALMDAAVDAIVVSDESGRIVRANRAAHLLFGYPDEELAGRDVNILMPDAVGSQHHNHLSRFLETGIAGIIGTGRDVQGKKRSGEHFPLHLSIGEAKTGEDRRFVAIMHDLKERHIAMAGLAQAQRLDAIGQMTGGVAHDFNNFLTVIIGNLELLDLYTTDAKARALLMQALEATEMATDLVSRLMLFARQGALDVQVADLSATCRKLLNMLRRTLGPGIEITTSFGDNVPGVALDLIHFQSAVLNLVLNARDAMPNGGELRISTQTVEIEDTFMANETAVPPGEYVCFTISDTGIGMDQKTCERVFEPFYTTKKSRDGTGLGLASVYGFVRQLGGNITVSSSPGDGTSFALYFPVAKDAAASLKDGLEDRGETLRGSGELVLVVEDTARVRETTKKRVRALGYRVAVASSGDEAWEMIRSGPVPDLVLTDLVMPGKLDGYALAEKIANSRPEIGILLTSGYASEIAASSREGDARFPLLHKPYHQRELARRLREGLT